MRSAIWHVSAPIVAALLLVACASDPSPAPSTTAPPSGSSPSPSAAVTQKPTAAPPSPSTTPDISGFSDVEAYLLDGVRADARIGCAPRRLDLPVYAVAGVECSPDVEPVDRIGVYLFTAQDDLLEAYFNRLADYGVEPRSGSCPDRAGEQSFVPGDEGSTIGLYRYGCYLNEFGNANYRFTAPDSLVYVGILGTGRDLEALHEWAWLGNPDVPGLPTVWRGLSSRP